MAWLARTVVTETPHHVTQRGNARQRVFDSDADRLVYLDLLRSHCRLQHLSLIGLPDVQPRASDRHSAASGVPGTHTQADARALRLVLQYPPRFLGTRLAGPLLLLPARSTPLLGRSALHRAEPGSGGTGARRYRLLLVERGGTLPMRFARPLPGNAVVHRCLDAGGVAAVPGTTGVCPRPGGGFPGDGGVQQQPSLRLQIPTAKQGWA